MVLQATVILFIIIYSLEFSITFVYKDYAFRGFLCIQIHF